ncbi:hypothetical protein DFH09DRAFT_1147899 [Mycena vulgaris]|nr:hypothetical protein DFH09DRAFT_1147899 [Mycena vulgaris]
MKYRDGMASYRWASLASMGTRQFDLEPSPSSAASGVDLRRGLAVAFRPASGGSPVVIPSTNEPGTSAQFATTVPSLVPTVTSNSHIPSIDHLFLPPPKGKKRKATTQMHPGIQLRRSSRRRRTVAEAREERARQAAARAEAIKKNSKAKRR